MGLINLIGFSVDENVTLSDRTECTPKHSKKSLLSFHVKLEQFLAHLAQILLSPSLPSMKQKEPCEMLKTPNKVRALTFIAFGKLSLRDSTLDNDCVDAIVR